MLAAWLIETFTRSRCTSRWHSRLRLLELLMFAPRLIEIFAGADSATRSWSNILALKAFSLTFRRSHTFGTSGRASRRRCCTEFFGTFALTRLSIFRSVWGSSSRRLHRRQALTRLGLLTKFAFVFAPLRQSRAGGWRRSSA